MRRKNSEVPSRIWAYGAGEPTTEVGRLLLRDQLGGALWYWNALVAIERDRRRECAYIETQIPEASVVRMREAKQAAKRAIKSSTLVAAKAIREQLHAALDALPGYAHIAAANARANGRVKDARSASRLHFGTYLLVEKAMEAAKKEPDEPNFKRFAACSGLLRGGQVVMAEGRLGAHIMGGADANAILSSTMLQIDWPELDRTEEGAAWAAGRSERRKKCRVLARIRAGSDVRRKPIWVEFPVTVHRPLPRDARIKAGWLACRYVGTRWEYSLELQLESTAFAASKPVGRGTVAMDLCWRRRDGGIRVAYLCDSTGAHREVLMPDDIVQDLSKADEIRGHADKVFDEAREALADDLGSLKLPYPHARKFDSLRLWKSPQRLAVAVAWWLANRFPDDDTAFASAWAYVQRWRHLHQFATGIRTRALGRRRAYYEDIALRIAGEYASVVVGDFDMRDCVELDKAAGDAPLGARHNRFAASPSEFRNVLKSTVTRLGGKIVIEDCADATLTCADCGHAHVLDPFAVDFRCVKCAAPWDRGHNHCRNLLRRASGSVPPRTPSPLEPMFPLVLAKTREEKAVRSRRRKYLSQSRSQADESTGIITQAVENLAQEVGP